MPDSLVDRLRAEDPETGLRHSIASEAADHIEELNRAFEAYATETMKRIDKLEAALEKITKTPPFGQPQMIARAALEGKDER
jgi:ferritin-like metal-binding protein YciE